MLRHQASRLKAVIADLRQIMKSFQHLLQQHCSPEPTSHDALQDTDGVVLDFEDCLKLLAKPLFDESGPEMERHDKLVSVSYVLYRIFPAEAFQALGRAGDKLHQAIGFLGRLHTSSRVLIAAARQMPGFDNLSLIPVVGLKARRKPASQEWSPAKTFQSLNLQLSDAVIEKLMEPSMSKVRWTKNKLLNDFSRLKSPTWEVHAEIQLIVFILTHPEEIVNGKRFEYIGCSRYSCVLCSQFLHFFQALKTRGCHGKLYNHSWTVPIAINLGKDEQKMLSEALTKLISWIRKQLKANTILPAQRRMEAKESTVGGSLIAIPGMSQGNRQQSEAASEYLHRQRAQNSHVRSRKERCVSLVNSSSLPLILAEHTEMALSSSPDPVEQVETSRVGAQHETPAREASKLCAGCRDVETSRRCSHCGGALFCSQACEQRMGLEHLLICNMREVTSADYLYDDVLADELPKDPQVRQDYWFDRCQYKSEETRLFGLFIGLLKYHYDRITREELHQWRSNPGGNPSLVARIVEKFEELPENNRGGYFPWFLENLSRFELPDGHHSIPRPPSPETQVQNMQAKARKYLAPEDQHKEVKDLTPYAKMHCFLFYGMAADHLHPPPINSEGCQWWFDFGFVVCHNQHEERELGSMYSKMILGSTPREENARSIGPWGIAEQTSKIDPACSFDEFWKAWERGTLMTIFDKCWPSLPEEETWLTHRDDLLGRLRVFLEAETPRPSIWMLRHFLALEGASVESAIPEIARAARDYGFSERLDTRTTMELKEFYVQLCKKAETLAIHRERLKGNLVQFAEGYVDIITPRVKEVLQGLL